MRTTITFAAIVEKANAMLENSKDEAKAERTAIHTFVTDLLLGNDIYAGFGYRDPYGSPGSDPTRTYFYRPRERKARA